MRRLIAAIFLLSIASNPVLSFLPQPLLPPPMTFLPTTTARSAKRIPRTTISDREPNDRTPPRPQRSAVTPTRAPHQFDHRLELARPFLSDARGEIQKYTSNADAPVLDWSWLQRQESQSSPAELVGDTTPEDRITEHHYFVTHSLDELFPGLQFSQHFAQSTEFRNALRMALREDIFDTTEMYHSLSEKAKRVLLLPDASLQGSWKCRNGFWHRKPPSEEASDQDGSLDIQKRPHEQLRMIQLTAVLQEYLGSNAPSGDVFMDTMGALCGSSLEASSSWTDVVGISHRRVPHSWQHETLTSNTVLLGFPPTDDYSGLGVFPHLVKLQSPPAKENDHAVGWSEKLQIDEEFIVRPLFAPQQEILTYSTRNVLCSEPDIAYRTSCMRFT